MADEREDTPPSSAMASPRTGDAAAPTGGEASARALLELERCALAAFVTGRVLHELGNPLSAVRSNLTFVSESLPELERQATGPALRALLGEVAQAVRDTVVAVEVLVDRCARLRAADTGVVRPAEGETELLPVVTRVARGGAGGADLPIEVVHAGAGPLRVALDTTAATLIVARALQLARLVEVGTGSSAGHGLRVALAGEGARVALRLEHRGPRAATEAGPAAHARVGDPALAGVAAVLGARRSPVAQVDFLALQDLGDRLGVRVLGPPGAPPSAGPWGPDGFLLRLEFPAA